MEKKAFNKENPIDLFSQLMKVLTREKSRGNMERLLPDVRSLSGKVFTEWKKPKASVAKQAEEIFQLVANKKIVFDLAKILKYKKPPRMKNGIFDIYTNVKSNESKKLMDKILKTITSAGFSEVKEIPEFLLAKQYDKVFADKKGKYLIRTYIAPGNFAYVYATVYDVEKYQKANRKYQDSLRKWVSQHSSIYD